MAQASFPLSGRRVLPALAWDTTRPDGTPRKRFDVAPLHASGWGPTIDLSEGITTTLAWYRQHVVGTDSDA